LLTLDYPAKDLRLAKGTLKPDGGNQVIPFTMPNDVPLIDLKVGTRTLSAHVDSRGHGLSVPAAFATDLKFQSEPIVIGRGRTVSNEFQIKGAQLADDVRLGRCPARPIHFPHAVRRDQSDLPGRKFWRRAVTALRSDLRPKKRADAVDRGLEVHRSSAAGSHLKQMPRSSTSGAEDEPPENHVPYGTPESFALGLGDIWVNPS
jgi:hypothetical protein